MPPVACAPHSSTCPATTAPASASRSSRPQPKCAIPGPDDQRGVGDPAGDDDVRPGPQALGDPEGAEVGVRGQRGAEPELRRARAAGRRPRRGPRPPARPAGRPASRSASARPAGFSPPALTTIRTPRSSGQAEALLHLREEGARVAAGGVLRAVAAEDQQGQLGEVVTGQDVERPALEHLPHRRPPVAVEARRVADPQRCRHAASRGRAFLARADRRRPARGPATGRRRGRSAVSARSARCRRWVTRRQKSSAGPVTRCAASSGPQAHVPPSGAVELHPERLGGRRQAVLGEGEVAGADADVRDVPQPRRDRRRRGAARR